jgi:hypothetical protein
MANLPIPSWILYHTFGWKEFLFMSIWMMRVSGRRWGLSLPIWKARDISFHRKRRMLSLCLEQCVELKRLVSAGARNSRYGSLQKQKAQTGNLSLYIARCSELLDSFTIASRKLSCNHEARFSCV